MKPPSNKPSTLNLGQFGECAEALSAKGQKAVFITASKPTAAGLPRGARRRPNGWNGNDHAISRRNVPAGCGTEGRD